MEQKQSEEPSHFGKTSKPNAEEHGQIFNSPGDCLHDVSEQADTSSSVRIVCSKGLGYQISHTYLHNSVVHGTLLVF